ncbi:hypothetical protein ACH6CV_17380 [Bacillota bacterium Meth-B3]
MDLDYLELLLETRKALDRARWARERLGHNRMKSECSTSNLQHTIRGKGGHSDPTANRAMAAYDYELDAKCAEEELEKNKAQIVLMAKGSKYPDLMQALYWRIVGGLSWEEVNKQLGGRYTAKGLRRAVERARSQSASAWCERWIQAIEDGA